MLLRDLRKQGDTAKFASREEPASFCHSKHLLQTQLRLQLASAALRVRVSESQPAATTPSPIWAKSGVSARAGGTTTRMVANGTVCNRSM